MKQHRKPGTMIYPLPALLVSCGSTPDEYNLITVSWTGTVCSEPPMCYISVRKTRHSHKILERNKEFVLNLTTKDLSYATDWCGVRSGEKFNKFKEMRLTPGKAAVVQAPTVEESPVNIECRVKEILSLGSHDMFLAEVVNVQVDEKYIDQATGKPDLEKAGLQVYVQGSYFELGKLIGKSGWSVEKKNNSFIPILYFMKRDQIVFDIIEKERKRQLRGIELIASENFVSEQVMQAMGSCLTNKYAEGYPGNRYYGGCEVVDESESLAIERLKNF